MRKYRKFTEGGDVNYGEDERPAATGMSDAAELMPEKPKAFKEAFRDARAAGDKLFTWQGKKYTTEMAGAQPKTSAPAPKAASSEIPKGKEVAPANTGKDTSGPSNLDRILMGVGAGAGVAGIAGAAKLAQMRRAEKAAEMSKAAAAKFSQPQARQIATQTGVKKQPAEQVKKEPAPPAKDSADTASPRKSRNIFERPPKKSDTEIARTGRTGAPRSRNTVGRDEEMTRRDFSSGGKVRGGGCEMRGKTRGVMR
jgi:hypothetical protein